MKSGCKHFYLNFQARIGFTSRQVHGSSLTSILLALERRSRRWDLREVWLFHLQELILAHPPGWLKAPTAATVFKRSKNARWNLVKATQATPGAVFIKNDKTGRFGSWQKINFFLGFWWFPRTSQSQRRRRVLSSRQSPRWWWPPMPTIIISPLGKYRKRSSRIDRITK